MNNTSSKTKVTSRTDSQPVSEISRVATTVIGFTAGIIGLWALACIISGVTQSGGPVILVSNLFHAIFG